MKLNFEPYFKKLLIEPLKEETFLQTEDNKLQQVGKVLKVGKGCKFCKVGDLVAFTSWGCDKTEYDNKTYYVVAEAEEFIIGKICKTQNAKEAGSTGT